jgi:excinuclease UvrABC helicase subunit UvrB
MAKPKEALNKAKIAELSENKKIFSSRQYLHNVPSIAELLGNKEPAKKEAVEDVVEETKQDYVDDEKLPKVELNKFKDVAFEIDLSDMDITIEDISVGLVGETKKKETKVEKKQYSKAELKDMISRLESEMREAASKLDFERATELRDILFELKDIK